MVVRAFDEMSGFGGECRQGYEIVENWLRDSPPELLHRRQQEAELLFRRIGITFNVYGDAEGEERLIPFDIVPRVITRPEWTKLAEGLRQRVTALNMFLKDVYSKGEIVRAGLIPEDLIYKNPCYRPEM